MGTEYELCKPEEHEFIELGKGSFSKIADILLKAKMKSLSYEEVWPSIEDCSFIKEMKDRCVYSDTYQIFDYLFWLKEFFFKKVYKWYSENVRLITDEEFAECYENNDEFKLICSRYTTEASKAEFIRTHKKDYLNAVKEWKKECEEKRNNLDNLHQLKLLLENIRSTIGKVELSKLSHDDRSKIYDVIFEGGLIDQALSTLEDFNKRGTINKK